LNICIIINTPAQVHFYKNIIKKLEYKGHNIIILARNYGITANLLDELKINYNKFNLITNSPLMTALSFPLDLFNIYRMLHNKKIDFILGFGMYDVFASKLTHSKSIVFYDSEPKINPFLNLQYKVFMPFVDSFISPSSFRENLGKKHIKINSYKELAYLHPKYYRPNNNIFDLLNISSSEEYIIMRFNNFDALHDVSKKGFSLSEKIELVNELSKYIKIYISFEGRIPAELQEYKLTIPKSRIHDLLFFSKLLITDTQTIATEAAILGTPVIRKNSFVGKGDMGNFIELENKYNLIYNLTNIKDVIKISTKIILDKNIKNIWREKREKLLKDKLDIVDFMVEYIEHHL